MSDFALIENGVVRNVIVSTQAYAQTQASTVVDLTGVNPRPGPGWTYNGASFAAPITDARPRLVITNVASDNTAKTLVDSQFREATCPVGTTLTFTAELRDSSNQRIPASDTFRMPLNKRGGGEGMLLATMVAGVVTIRAAFTTPGDDGAWVVDEATINASLPPASQMRFAGFVANVYRA
ncbi:hypothetical protein [Chitinimonas sp.]|uniref:hypothetical protein n=1 Tax=Chitinimonas sp. TaxID=1934313 RepID=UPI0035B35F4A